MPKELSLIAHNIRSTHNVGSLLRTADGLGLKSVYLTGYTPYPKLPNDSRLPHLAAKIDSQIRKTSLGAESSVDWRHIEDVQELIASLKQDGVEVVALEQFPGSVQLDAYAPPSKSVLIVGAEVEGLEPGIIDNCDKVIEIPMRGAKESFNVSVAAAIALHALLKA